jgi:hypothetical protein
VKAFAFVLVPLVVGVAAATRGRDRNPVQAPAASSRVRRSSTRRWSYRRDGGEAATARRNFGNASVCYLDVDASAPDIAGDQTWCTHVAGYVDSRFIGEASACEADEF